MLLKVNPFQGKEGKTTPCKIKARLNGFNICSTKVERMLGKCWTQKSYAEAVQMVPTLCQQKNQQFREI